MAGTETTKDADADADAVNERLKAEWMDRLTALLESVEGWARELGWSTRRIEKKMKDFEIGPYEAPALLMQEETTRALLDPIGRSAIGADGVVDLYLMPAFDDIARLTYRDGQWWLNHASGDPSAVATSGEPEPMPLSGDSLGGVLESMKQNAR